MSRVKRGPIQQRYGTGNGFRGLTARLLLPGSSMGFVELGIAVDNAAWHRGRGVEAALAKVPHVELYRLPSYSPHLNVAERLWKLLRRRATHDRLFLAVEKLHATPLGVPV